VSYGDIIRKRREKLGLTQAELAKLTGLDQTIISRIETGTKKLITAHAEKLLPALSLKFKLRVVKKKKRNTVR
jgi:transcriptional regulator with XRE-family HTH domain